MLDDVTRRGGREHAAIGEERVQTLATAGRAEADPHRRSRIGGEEPALDQALEIDGHVEPGAADARAEPSHFAQHLARAGRAPHEPAPEPRVHRHHGIEVRMIAENGVLARLDHPRQMRLRHGASERARHGQSMDHVAERGELDDGDARPTRCHRALPNRSAMSRIRSRVAWLFGSPAMATRPPASLTAAPSGTDSAV